MEIKLTYRNPIWEAELDNRYSCKVTREGQYTGILTVLDTVTGNTLMSEEVELSYGAMFGADMADIGYWEEKIIGIIDGNKG